MKQGTILIVDDNRNILTTVKMLLENTFEHIVAIANPNNIPAHLREDKPDVVLLDMNFQSGINSGNEGLYWLGQIKKMRPQAKVVLFTAYADIELAVSGIKAGATDFIVKPFDNDKLIATLKEACSKSAGGSDAGSGESGMYWGVAPCMQELRLMVTKVAATDAKADKAGKFELAEGGTLFLDEIGNLSYALQAKLLTALQRRSIVRVGGSVPIPIDVRLICATNRDLSDMVTKGEFREDLLYRINTIHLHLPSLRERREDIPALARLFLNRYAAMYNKPAMELTPAAEQKIKDMPWYGNIRELQHAIEKAVILSDGREIGEQDISGSASVAEKPMEGVQTIGEMESRLIEKTIRECDGNLSQVASRLGVSRQTLYNKIKKYGL